MFTNNMKTHTPASLKQFHLRAGWLGLLLFLSLGIGLEALHAVKSPFYLDDRNATRRLMWTLAHSHGTLFSLINIAFAFSVAEFESVASLRWISRGLIAALILLPSGFFLGGFGVTGGDPCLGVLLAPVGALAMLAAVFQFVRALFAQKTPPLKSRKGSHS
jgi:hypothetical protein